MKTLAVISNLLSDDGLVIFLVLLFLFGSKRLPELARVWEFPVRHRRLCWWEWLGIVLMLLLFVLLAILISQLP